MSDKENKICPCCHREIVDEDNFVVCGTCRTPHHTKCWLEKKRCSVTGCNGTSTSSGYGKTDSPFYINAQTQIVPQKSYALEKRMSSDSKIGEDFVTMALIKQKAEYYIPKFKDMDSTKGLISFNLAAFVLGWYWCLYRKLYLFAVIFMAAELCVINLPVKNVVKCIILAVMFFANGLTGNFIYKKRIYRCRVKALQLKEPQREEYISKVGGVNIAVPVVMLIVVSLVSLVQQYLPFVKIFADMFD